MSAYASDPSPKSAGPSLDRLFEELASQLERTAFLYGNAAFFDLERARRLRRDFDTSVAKAEGFVSRDEAPTPQAFARADRGQRIETEIVAFIQDMAKPVTIDEVAEHLAACSLGEPRPSLITRMSRMAAANKLARYGRGYYELAE